MSKATSMGNDSQKVAPPIIKCGRAGYWLIVALFTGSTFARQAALAGEPECGRESIQHRAYKNAKSNKPQDTVASFERELAACKDKLSPTDHLDLLIQIVREQLESPPDLEGCRRVAERGLRLVENGGPAQEINRSYGYCGGDCKKAVCVPCCEVGAKRRQKDLKAATQSVRQAKMSEEERDMEQDVPCDLGKARQTAARLDKAGFGDSALRLIAKYRQTCAKNRPPAEEVALANDQALIHFHRGDDGSCVKALTGISDDVVGTAFNRALCGGPCSLDPITCAKAAEARKKAMVSRALQKKLRERTQAWCASHSPEDTGLPAWDLPTNPGWAAQPRDSGKLIWAGDINGDGLGDLVERWDGYWEDTSNAALDNALPRGALTSVRWKAYRVSIGCPKVGLFVQVMERNTEFDKDPLDHPDQPDDKTAIRMLDQPGRTIRSVCVYPSRNLKCSATKCNREPDQCADLAEWEEIERPTGKTP